MTGPATRPLLGLAAAGLVAALAGCATLPAVTAPASEGTPLVVEPAQAAQVTREVADVVGAGADPASVDLDALAARVEGPELDLRRAAATLVRAGQPAPVTGGADELTPQGSVLPREAGWPRWFATVTDPGADQLPSLVVLRSADARTPYRVWASPSLLPGATLPSTGIPAEGVAPVAVDEDVNLPATPQAVAERYADLLVRGDASGVADQFAPDAYRTAVTEGTDAQRAALEGAGGTLTQERALLPDGVVASRTRDGGALVVAGYRWTVTSAGPADGLRGTLSPAVEVLADEDRERRVVTTTEEVVVFAVPPAGAGQVQVVAVQAGLVAADAG